MKKFFEKRELLFAIIVIVLYVVGFSVCDSVSQSIGIPKLVTAIFSVLLTAALLLFAFKNGLAEYFGLCRFGKSAKKYLFFLPLFVVGSVNLWNGVALNTAPAETAAAVVTMLCVGFLEEFIFRGLLFNAIAKTNTTQAMVIVSVSFGLGHIVNLLNGAPVFDTLLQLVYAMAIGFMLTALVYRGNSLIPCIILHAVVDVTSIFNVDGGDTYDLVVPIIITLVSVSYGAWIMLACREKTVSQSGAVTD